MIFYMYIFNLIIRFYDIYSQTSRSTLDVYLGDACENVNVKGSVKKILWVSEFRVSFIYTSKASSKRMSPIS